ncbi:MAG: DUF805 domain-containing protein [Alphaproteobacteria bacterium]|nr:DUF805 domain-containing protein [Alphaproteobacteria bacterium]MBV9373235.1 DUF805 domain-containing protein [Alphaproteobacteria bacterium]MBV9900623.1 DUF805 domain-containing protein [Alphaproteobacteria bacterium]
MEYMFLPLKRYAEFSGRSRRMEYWMFTLFIIVMWVVLFGLMIGLAGTAILGGFGSGGGAGSAMAAGGAIMIVLVLCGLLWLVLLIPSIAVGIRRLHDTDRSGWWLGGYFLLAVVSNVLTRSSGPGALSMLFSLAVLIYAIMLFVFMVLDGTKGPNKYGPDPKGRVDAEVFA